MCKLPFSSDYMQGAHPAVLRRLAEENLTPCAGYGSDRFSEAAREKIRAACGAPEAEIFFLTGGTQTNATVIGCMLQPWQGVVAADTGHVAVHEAGAIESGGHKVLTLPSTDGKLSADTLEAFVKSFLGDENREHMVAPGMVYLSQPTELGTLYSLAELRDIRRICREYNLRLYVDGARLAYALACPANDVTLRDLAENCDAFYIGGTKCGTLFGEAVVLPRKGAIPHFLTLIKQHGALLAKGFVAGLQFDALFTGGLYELIGRNAVAAADRIRAALDEKAYEQAFPSPTNQIFPLLKEEQYRRLSEKADLSFWERHADGRTVVRIATSWATTEEDVGALISIL